MATYGRDAKALLFLSTPSARRATKALTDVASDTDISIHALREEGDSQKTEERGQHIYFYPRPPRGGRRWSFCAGLALHQISIHALREEGDDLSPGPVPGFS